MEISLEQIKGVFKEWSKDYLENPDNYDPVISDKESIEEYSESQANDFIRIFKKLNP